MNKRQCANTYFNREIGGYIEMLLNADGLLSVLEKAAAESLDAEALKVSQELDVVIAGIMEKRRTVSEILLADSTFN